MSLPKPEITFDPERKMFTLKIVPLLAESLVIRVCDKSGKDVVKQHKIAVNAGDIPFDESQIVRRPTEGEELTLEAWFINKTNPGDDGPIEKITFTHKSKTQPVPVGGTGDAGGSGGSTAPASSRKPGWWKHWIRSDVAFVILIVIVLCFAMFYPSPNKTTNGDTIASPAIIPPLLSSSTNVTEGTATNVSTEIVTQRTTNITNVYGVTITNTNNVTNQFNIVNTSNITNITHLNEVIGTSAEPKASTLAVTTNMVVFNGEVRLGDNAVMIIGNNNQNSSMVGKKSPETSTHTDTRSPCGHLKNVNHNGDLGDEKLRVFTIPDDITEGYNCGSFVLKNDQTVVLYLKDGWSIGVDGFNNEPVYLKGVERGGKTEKAIPKGSVLRGYGRVSFYSTHDAPLTIGIYLFKL